MKLLEIQKKFGISYPTLFNWKNKKRSDKKIANKKYLLLKVLQSLDKKEVEEILKEAQRNENKKKYIINLSNSNITLDNENYQLIELPLRLKKELQKSLNFKRSECETLSKKAEKIVNIILAFLQSDYSILSNREKKEIFFIDNNKNIAAKKDKIKEKNISFLIDETYPIFFLPVIVEKIKTIGGVYLYLTNSGIKKIC